MSQKGILGRKLGMTQIFDESNRVIPVSVVEAGPCRVVQLRTPERDGYSAVQIAFGETKASRLTKPELGHLKAAGGPPQRYLAELRVDDLSGFELGQIIAADVFAAGERVDVTGISKGSGFSGVMKRHNFSGQGASHGNHKKHRSPGAIGACATPARVFKGMKMAGQMGNEKVTTLNLEIVEGDAERGLLLIKGSIPGPSGGLVFVRSAIKAQVRGMSSLSMKTADGAAGDNVDLPDAIFGIEPNVAVMHQVVTAQLAAKRSGTHSTKTRAEVRGGGAKPWRQKGTGRARQGSIRAPQWRGGGVAHGPHPRDYSQRTPKKMIRLALRSALSDRASEGKVIVVDNWGITEPNTKAGVKLLVALGLRNIPKAPAEKTEPTTATRTRAGSGRTTVVSPATPACSWCCTAPKRPCGSRCATSASVCRCCSPRSSTPTTCC